MVSSEPGRIVILHRRYDEIGRLNHFSVLKKSSSKEENVRNNTNIEQIILDDASKHLFVVWSDIEHMQNRRHCDEYIRLCEISPRANSAKWPKLFTDKNSACAFLPSTIAKSEVWVAQTQFFIQKSIRIKFVCVGAVFSW